MSVSAVSPKEYIVFTDYNPSEHPDSQELHCSICKEDINKDEKGLLAHNAGKIHHVFHKACLDPWLANHDTCPLCKKQIQKQWSALEIVSTALVFGAIGFVYSVSEEAFDFDNVTLDDVFVSVVNAFLTTPL